MTQKMYFVAIDKQDNYGLWVTDGAHTKEIGGLSNVGVAGVSSDALGAAFITPFGQQMIFAGQDALNDGAANGIWLTDGSPGGTTEVGGVSPGPNKSSPFIGGNPVGLDPQAYVAFGAKALFTGLDASNFSGVWSTDGTVGGTVELGGLGNGQIVGRGVNWSPSNFAAFNASVLFNAYDSSGGGQSYKGLWITDGTTAGTVEIGGLQNAAIFDSNASSFVAINEINLGGLELFAAPSKDGNQSLWITDGTAAGTVEIGGVDNAGIVGADKNVDFGDGLSEAVRFGARVFFAGPDNDGSVGLWTTDGTAAGTLEIGGIDDGGLTAYSEHPSSIGLHPTQLTVSGQRVLFNGRDAIGYQELWVSDGTGVGTVEIGGEGPGGFLAHEASNGLNPESMVALGNGKTVFIGYDDSNNQASGKAALWVTDGTFAGTHEIGGVKNQGIAGINSGGFSFTGPIIGGDGLAYFEGENSAGQWVLWETDGTQAGTKLVPDTDGNARVTGLSATSMAMANPPAAETSVTGGGKSVDLNAIPGEDVAISATNGVCRYDHRLERHDCAHHRADRRHRRRTADHLQRNLLGGAVADQRQQGFGVRLQGRGDPERRAGQCHRPEGRDHVCARTRAATWSICTIRKGHGTRSPAPTGPCISTARKASVTGGGNKIYFDGGTGDDVSIYSTNNVWDTVYASGGPIEVNASQVSVVGGSDTITATAGSSVSLYQTNGNWDLVNATGSNIYLNGAQASIVGGANAITATKGSTASLYNTGGAWDSFTGSGSQVILTNAQASIIGGGDLMTLDSKSSVSLSSTGGNWDGVTASGATIILTTAQAAITGGGNTIWANSGSTVSLAGTGGAFDAVYGSSEGVILNHAQASILGGYNTVYADAGSTISIYNTGVKSDVLNAANDAVYLNSSQAVLNGSANVIYMSGNSALAANGLWEAVHFGAQIGEFDDVGLQLQRHPLFQRLGLGELFGAAIERRSVPVGRQRRHQARRQQFADAAGLAGLFADGGGVQVRLKATKPALPRRPRS